MAKHKYYYAVVRKDNGNLLLEDAKLPIYWNKKVAQRVCIKYDKYLVTRINIADVERLILSSKPLTKTD